VRLEGRTQHADATVEHRSAESGERAVDHPPALPRVDLVHLLHDGRRSLIGRRGDLSITSCVVGELGRRDR
jgi:hypothetical protein